MSKYNHSIVTTRKKTEFAEPTLSTAMVQVVFGTAPINTLEDPAAAVNVPILLKNADEVKAWIGKAGPSDMEEYTLLHAVQASFYKHAIAPIVVVNVLDPNNNNHVEVVTNKECTLVGGRIVLEETGILPDKVNLSLDDTVFQGDTDYVASFDEEGYLVISATPDGALSGKDKVDVSYAKLNPAGVSLEDIVGGVDADGNKTGIALLDEVFPETGIIPGIVIAPYYSKYPEVALAMEAAVQNVYSAFNAVAFVDLDSSEAGADTYLKVPKTKEENLLSSRWIFPVWPMVKSDGYVMAKSAFDAALLQSVTVENGGIPSESIDNHDLLIDGVCNESGDRIQMTQEEVNDYLNAYGVTGALKLPTWKAWGNNTAAYPDSSDPIERWMKGVTMLNYLENKFKSDYLSRIGRDANYKLIEGIVGEFNMTLNSLVPDHLAGAEILFNKEDNPISNLQVGHLVFRTRYADYAPTEYIENEFAYDISMLAEALSGGEEDE